MSQRNLQRITRTGDSLRDGTSRTGHMIGEGPMKKVFFALVGVMVIIGMSQSIEAYQEGTVTDGGMISGKVFFDGTVPDPKVYRLKDFYNDQYCGQISDDKGNRILEEVRMGGEGALQDVVVTLSDIKSGKPFKFQGTDVKAFNCQFLVQGGPSTFTGVVMRNAELRLKNEDADPNDPSMMIGLRHNPQANEITGKRSLLMFKQLLSTKGQIVKKKVKLKRKGSFMKLECDIHDYMQTYFWPITNPYYAIVEKDGSFKIDEIPPGKYKVVAWHPILGKIKKKVRIQPKESTEVEFTFHK